MFNLFIAANICCALYNIQYYCIQSGNSLVGNCKSFGDRSNQSRAFAASVVTQERFETTYRRHHLADVLLQLEK